MLKFLGGRIGGLQRWRRGSGPRMWGEGVHWRPRHVGGPLVMGWCGEGDNYRSKVES